MVLLYAQIFCACWCSGGGRGVVLSPYWLFSFMQIGLFQISHHGITIMKSHLKSVFRLHTYRLHEQNLYTCISNSLWSRACFHFVFGPMKLKLTHPEILLEMLAKCFFLKATIRKGPSRHFWQGHLSSFTPVWFPFIFNKRLLPLSFWSYSLPITGTWDNLIWQSNFL